MSLFIQIRNKRIVTIIVIFIGICLGFFVLETALNSNSNLLKGNSDVVGIIDGDKVHYNDFNAKVDDMVESYKLNTKQKSLDEATMFSLRDQTWNQMVQDHINDQEFSALGISVPDDEMKDLFFGADPYPQVRKSFTDKNGQFNPMYVKQYISMLDKPIEGQPEPAVRREQWINFEKAVKEETLDNKFKALLTGGLYVPKWEAEMIYTDKEKKFDISYVKIPYTVIADSAVKVTDAEMQAYLDAHKQQYKQDESRKIEYVIFPVKPSAEDTAKAKKFVMDAYNHLVANPNDTNFIKLNADNSYDKTYYNKEKVGLVSKKAADTLQSIAIGTIVSPYFEDGSFKMVKLTDRKSMPDSVKFSLIIISKGGADSAKAERKTDSIMAGLKSGADFADAAQKFSDDKNTGAKGGDQGYVSQGRTFKQLDDFLFFGGAVGEIKKLNLGSAYGIVKITEAPPPATAFQFIIVSRKVEASSATDKAVYEIANKFGSTNGTAELFDKALAANPRLDKQVAESVKKNDFQLPGLATARDLVKWTYNAKKDDISNVYALDQNYVIAHLVGIKSEGTQELTPELKPQIEAEVRKEKKGAQIAAQLNSSLSLNATLESIAAKMGQEVKTAPGISFSTPFLPNLGFEPKLIGAVSAMKVNQLSKPILGANGVFVVKVTNATDAKPIADYTMYKQQELQTLSQRFQYGLTEAMKKTIKVEDNRYLFY